MFKFNHFIDFLTEKHPSQAGAFFMDNLSIERKSIKHLYLRINPTNGHVCVTAPKRMKDTEIAQFLQQKQDWIAKKRQQLRHKIQLEPVSKQSLEQLLLWGRTYRICLESSNSHRIVIDQNNEQVTLYVSNIADKPTIQHQLNQWLREQLQQQIQKRLPDLEALSHVRAKECRIKAMKTRWGTCSIRAARIWINAELVQLPKDCLDYILLHELVHLHEASHNARFHGLMTEFMPNWKAHDDILNRYILPRS